ncbi:hypothetical protein OZ401_001723 [Candidatus Chlorohelix allophototropha]|uniref:Uncharacterized protein n=1 Tax=Candidatus Chlorohelix allophototropha TaxID=3003348 RepID=A0ABY9AYF1_9CHLR|nr:hypothetical protein OZ401_001723 [Chloroflexota bacterium L227-S17]
MKNKALIKSSTCTVFTHKCFLEGLRGTGVLAQNELDIVGKPFRQLVWFVASFLF